jgi:hypothetical protein
MTDPRLIAYLAVAEKIAEGAKKHDPSAWRHQPPTMHLSKAARHLMTAILLIDHPDYTKDAESAADHIKQAITRATMSLEILEGK